MLSIKKVCRNYTAQCFLKDSIDTVMRIPERSLGQTVVKPLAENIAEKCLQMKDSADLKNKRIPLT